MENERKDRATVRGSKVMESKSNKSSGGKITTVRFQIMTNCMEKSYTRDQWADYQSATVTEKKCSEGLQNSKLAAILQTCQVSQS